MPLEIKHAIEHPVLDRVPERRLTVKGWCFNCSPDKPLRGIRARVGDAIVPAKRKQTRPNVGRLFPDFPEAHCSGFSVEINLPRGRSTVVLEYKDTEKKWHEFERLHLSAPWLPWLWRRRQDNRQDTYQEWVRRYGVLSDSDRRAMRQEMEESSVASRFLISVRITRPDLSQLKAALKSIQNQLYPHWKVCLAIDGPRDRHLENWLSGFCRDDDRFFALREQTEGAIWKTTEDEFFCEIGQYDRLAEDALFRVANYFEIHPETEVVFTDEDEIDSRDRRSNPWCKPAFNRDLLLSRFFFGGLTVFRREALKKIDATSATCPWDLCLRLLERSGNGATSFRRLAKILYHRSESDPVVPVSGESARMVADHLHRLGHEGVSVSPDREGFCHWVRWSIPDPAPKATLIIPTRDFVHLLRPCIDSILSRTDYPDYEILIVDNDSEKADTLRYFEEISANDQVRILSVPGPFNYSLLNNRAVAGTDSRLVALVNNDIEVVSEHWLTEMAGHALRPDVGAVGAKLLYHDGRVQHAGVVIGMQAGAGHLFRGAADSRATHGGRADLTQNYSAVTAACLVIEKRKYEEVGGLNEADFAVNFNDVDFCLKLVAAGYRNVYTPFATLYHHESASRATLDATREGADRSLKESRILAEKWPGFFDNDPAYSPNLSLDTDDASLAFPPRLQAVNRMALG